MPRRVFFSFHFQADHWRVGQVRNYALTKRGVETHHPIDHAEWEKIQRTGKTGITSWIENQLKGSSVTVVLIGQETHKRPYVNYEIQRSIELGKGLIGIRIHKLKDQNKKTTRKGKNPLASHIVTKNRPIFFGLLGHEKEEIPAAQVYKTYCWDEDNGPENFPKWVEEAIAIAKNK